MKKRERVEISAPETSVIIPVYNSEEFITDAVASILEGSYTDYEIILVDDGSEDNSLGVCEKLAAENNCISVISIEHGGVSAARNAGLDASKGELIAFVDADDFVTSDYLQILADSAREKNLDYVGCGWKETPDTSENSTSAFSAFESDVEYRGQEASRILSDVCLVKRPDRNFKLSSACMSVFRKRIVDQHDIRFRSDISYGEDTLFTYTFSHYIDSFSYIHKPMYYYRRHSDSSSEILREDYFLSHISNLIDEVTRVASEFDEEKTETLKQYKIQSILYGVIHSALPSCDYKKYEEVRLLLNTYFDKSIPYEYLFGIKEKVIIWLIMQKHYRTLKLLYFLFGKRTKSFCMQHDTHRASRL